MQVAEEGPGQRIASRYRVVQMLGRGGMGAVYSVVDESTGAPRALKWMLESGAAASLRFRREFHTLASLTHPRIVAAHDYGVEESCAYYTMELLDGRDLREIATLEPREAARLLRDVASALAYLHSRRLLHRDLSARNVRCTADGRAKLIDFGVLATMGVSGEVVGTPSSIPPEMLYGVALDQRADLFGLGTLAYRLLTGRHAFPATRPVELFELHPRRPVAPSRFQPGAAGAFDDLVLSLLSADPLGRPSSAAEVIDRLGAIAGLERAPELEVARSYLFVSSLVGREREMSVLRGRVARALSGAGRAIVVRGRSGSGKTRLLRELGLEAQMSGAVAVRVAADGVARGPYGLFRELAAELVAAAPDDAIAAARQQKPVLGRTLPELARRLWSDAGPEGPVIDPREQRFIVQRELEQWVLGVSRRRPLVLAVDDLQRCDEGSAAVLAGLASQARRHALLVVATLRSDEPILAPSPVKALAGLSSRMRLRGLAEADVESLVQRMFGQVPNVAKLARLMRDAAGGSPLVCEQIARHLVDRGEVRYVDGMWVIPDELGRDHLPPGIEQTMDARVAVLSDAARTLGLVLALLGRSASLELAASLAKLPDDRVFAALDELVREELLWREGERYTFRHEPAREALVRNSSQAERKALHLRIGRTLLGGPRREELELETGWHLYSGGDEPAGAALLERAGRRLFEATSFRESIEPLEAALAVLEREQKSPRAVVEIKEMLLTAGFYCDRHLAFRHAQSTMDLLEHYSGLGLAARAAPLVGVRVGLGTGLFVSAVRHLLTPRRRRGPDVEWAIRLYARSVAYVASLHAFCFDVDGIRRLYPQLEPLRALPHATAWGVYVFVRNLHEYLLGNFELARESSEHVLASLKKERGIPKVELDHAEGALRFQLGIISVLDARPRLLEDIARIEALGLNVWTLAALQLRLVHHLWRGESEPARDLEQKLELEFVRLGASWQLEVWMPANAAMAYGYLGDVVGLKRSIEQLSQFTALGRGYAELLDVARGEYHRARGEHELARECIERALANLPPGQGLARPWALAALAETLFESGRLYRAADAASEGVAYASQPARAQPAMRLRCARVLWLARARLGRTRDAVQALDRLVDEAQKLANPAVLGPLHEALAELALAEHDARAFDAELERVAECYRPTRNPVLIARVERLEQAAAGRLTGRSAPPPEAMLAAELPTVVTLVDRIRSR